MRYCRRPNSCFVCCVAAKRKSVYVNDRLIGEASSWTEVHALMRIRGLAFISEPGAAEGPFGFYISGRPPPQRSWTSPNRQKRSDL